MPLAQGEVVAEGKLRGGVQVGCRCGNHQPMSGSKCREDGGPVTWAMPQVRTEEEAGEPEKAVGFLEENQLRREAF